jgi:hypothetical protein
MELYIVIILIHGDMCPPGEVIALLVNIYHRGLKLKLIGGPHSKAKMLCKPQFEGKKDYAGRKLLEKL